MRYPWGTYEALLPHWGTCSETIQELMGTVGGCILNPMGDLTINYEDTNMTTITLATEVYNATHNKKYYKKTWLGFKGTNGVAYQVDNKKEAYHITRTLSKGDTIKVTTIGQFIQTMEVLPCTH